MAEAQRQDNKVRLAFRIGYLGDGFYGSQYQPDRRTVEGEVINACLRGGLFSDPRSARLTISGRTDRGVHSRSQIIAFSTSLPDRAERAFPGQLPPDIWVTHICRVPDSYSPRYDVISRTYRYIYRTGLSDCSTMQAAASLFIGTHDFSCFARIEPGKNPMRTITALVVHQDHGTCWLEVSAQSFLWHMVRCVASALYEVSESRMTADDILRLLSGRCTNKMRPADPEGLILWEIEDRLKWQPLPTQNRTTRLHTKAAAYHVLMARVHTLIAP